MFEAVTAPCNDNRFERSLAAPVNRVSLNGRLAADPEVRVTGSGRWIVHLLLATDHHDDRARIDAACNRVVVVDEQLSRLAGEDLAKGERVQVEGQLQTRPATDDRGRPLVTTEIVLSGRQARLIPLDRPTALVTFS